MSVTEGIWLAFCDPEAGETCEYGLHLKRKNRWGTYPCGDPAFTVINFHRYSTTESTQKLILCSVCVARVIKELASMLAYGVKSDREDE